MKLQGLSVAESFNIYTIYEKHVSVNLFMVVNLVYDSSAN